MTKLHIGCGKRNWPGWENIDGGNYPHIKWHDVTTLRNGDNTVDLVYSSHLIAYFDREEIVPILQEWYRVLKPGGVLRLSTPDWDVLKAFKTPVLGPLYGKMNIGNNIIYHKTVYDFIAIKTLLFNTGFKIITRYDHTKTDHPNTGNFNDPFDDHSAAYIEGILISLNVEVVK